MPFILFIAFETFIFWFAVQTYGFLPVFAAYWLPCILGFYLLSLGSMQALQNLQMEINKGGHPAKSSLHLALKFLGSLLFLFPFLTTRVIGVILLIPWFRQMVIWMGEFWLIKRIFKSPYVGFVYQAGNFTKDRGFGGARDVFTPPLEQSPEQRGPESTRPSQGEVIDVDFVSLDDKEKK